MARRPTRKAFDREGFVRTLLQRHGRKFEEPDHEKGAREVALEGLRLAEDHSDARAALEHLFERARSIRVVRSENQPSPRIEGDLGDNVRLVISNDILSKSGPNFMRAQFRHVPEGWGRDTYTTTEPSKDRAIGVMIKADGGSGLLELGPGTILKLPDPGGGIPRGLKPGIRHALIRFLEFNERTK